MIIGNNFNLKTVTITNKDTIIADDAFENCKDINIIYA